jgi:ribosome recycling factor
MAYNFAHFNTKTKEIEEWLKREYSGLRTGRATPAVLDVVQVESYGAKMAINQVASVTIEDAKTIRISPWDSTQIKPIEKAIMESNVGLSVVVDDKGLRAVFPALTTERRAQILKVAGQKLEEARVSVRGEREKIWEDIQKQEKDGKLTEDDKFRLKTDLQKLVDEANTKLDEHFKRKETEIQS